MNPQHIIHGGASAFSKSINKLVNDRDVALKVTHVSCNGGVLAAVVEELPLPVNASGALLEVSVHKSKDPNGHIAKLREENPLWRAAAVFADESEAKGKGASVIVVAILVQP